MASTIVLALLASTALGLVASPHARDVTPDALVDGPEFNVTSALQDLGIAIDDIPGLEGYSSADHIETCSSLPGCRAAVSDHSITSDASLETDADVSSARASSSSTAAA